MAVVIHIENKQKNKSTLSRYHSVRRNKHGAGMVEAAVGMLIISGLVAVGLVFLVNLAMMSYYKDKIGVLTNQAAGYAANLVSWGYSNNAAVTDALLSSSTAAVIRDALGSMGLPSSDDDVTVTAQRNTDDTVKVSISVSNLRLTGHGNILPMKVTLTDSAIATLNNDKPPMLVRVGTGGYRSAPVAVVPAFGKYDSRDPQNVLAGLSARKIQQLGWHVSNYSDSNIRQLSRSWNWGDGWVTE